MKFLTLSSLIISLGIFIPQAQAWEMKQAPLMTKWASQVDTNAPLPEYPRPQMVRNDWLNLNGFWQFQAGDAHEAVPTGKDLSDTILVPFPMESPLSGIMTYHPYSWYRRTFTVPAGWSGKHIILHLDAVSWESEVFINGMSLGVHKGSYDPISYDITSQLKGNGPQELIVRVYAPVDNYGEPRGKQTLHPRGIMYTSSSGIWQPVWIEPVSEAGISNLKMVPDVDNGQLHLAVNTYAADGVSVSVTVSSNGVPVTTVSGAPNTQLDIAVPNARLWSPEDPFLYDLKITTSRNGTADDAVTSYFGMRKISVGTVDGVKKMFLNNKFVFQLGPLDQGFWPDGNYTAPTDEALRSDIEAEKAFGFNMVRKHIKVERARWYYWADKLGIMVWQDMPSVNSYTQNPQPIDKPQFELELNRMVENRWNSPCIILWVIFNENQGQHDVEALVNEIKQKDPSRLVNQGSGGPHAGVGDLLDVHSYPAPGCPDTTNQVRACGEFGGVFCQIPGHIWNADKAAGTYTKATDPAQQLAKYELYINDIIWLKSSQGLSAGVYTEITDVETEGNGLMTYDRILKLDPDKIKEINERVINSTILVKPVVPTSEKEGANWKFTTDQPGDNWFATDFNDQSWTSGLAGFGEGGRTPWRTQDIWIRRQFTLGSLSQQDMDNLMFDVAHRGDCQIYINGVPAGGESGRSNSYGLEKINEAGKAALVQNGVNVLAVHCHRIRNLPFVDVGLVDEEFHTTEAGDNASQ